MHALGVPVLQRRLPPPRLLWLIDAIEEKNMQTLLLGMSRVISPMHPIILSAYANGLQEIKRLKPDVVLIAGATRADQLFNEQKSLDEWRKKIQYVVENRIPVQVTFPLSQVLEQPANKRLAYQDLLQLQTAFRTLQHGCHTHPRNPDLPTAS